MRQATQKEHATIHIRAVHPWPSEQQGPAPIVLSAAEQAELLRLSEVIVFETEGSQIFAQGQSAEFVYYLAEGVVQGGHALDDGDRQIVAFYWPGDFFGLARDGLYLNSAEVVTSSKVYRFPVRKLEAFLLDHPKIQNSLLIKAIHEVRSAQRRLIVMGRFDVPRRLAIFLLDCAEHHQYFDAANQILTIPMTRYDIADYIGTSPESVTRAMSALEGKGLIRRITARMLELKRAELRTFTSLD